MKSRVAAIALAVLFATPAYSQSETFNPFDLIKKGLDSVVSSVTSPEAWELKRLVDQGDLLAADEYYSNQRTHLDGKPEHLPLLQRLADGVNSAKAASLEKALKAIERLPVDVARSTSAWGRTKDAIGWGNLALKDYEEFVITRNKDFRSGQAEQLGQRIAALTGKLAASAPTAFANFGHVSGRGFFDVYPVNLNRSYVLAGQSETFERIAKSSTADQLAQVLRKYPDLPSHIVHAAITTYATAAVSAKAAPLDFQTAFNVRSDVRRLGSYDPAVPGLAMRVINASSSTAGSNFKFIPTSRTSLPIVNGELPSIDSDSDNQKADYILIFYGRPNEVSRKVTQRREIASRYASGSRRVPNPQYESARIKYFEAAQSYARQQGTRTPTYSAGAAILQGLADGLSASAKDTALQELRSTPQTTEETVYSDYAFKVSVVEAKKSGMVYLAVLDRKHQQVAVTSQPWERTKTFEIAYGIHANDPDRYQAARKYVGEDQIDVFESETQEYLIEELVTTLTARSIAFTPYVHGQPLFAESTQLALAPKQNAAVIEPEDAATRAKLDSVVIIVNPKGGLGSGFFVAPELVLTNFHVVEGVKLAEVRLRNGKQTVGRIIKHDVGLDLALVKITEKGSPATFYGLPIAAGSTVEAVGHPRGLTYSITRGVVSAVRKMKNPLVPGSAEMLVIQTDAAINPGNSGGPLYLDGRVIGVNTQKLSANGVEGLGFAVHYSEVTRFLQD